MELTLERYGQALVDQTAKFAETAYQATVDAPVPTCPEWTSSQLVEHVGQTQHWVASIVEQRVSDPSRADVVRGAAFRPGRMGVVADRGRIAAGRGLRRCWRGRARVEPGG